MIKQTNNTENRENREKKSEQRHTTKILILTSSFPNDEHYTTNGYFVYELAHKLSKSISVHVLCPHAKGLMKKEQSNKVKIIRFQYFFSAFQSLAYGNGISENLKNKPLNYLLIAPFVISQFFAILKQIKQENYTLVHVQWLIPQGIIYALVRFFFPKAPPFIITSHGSDINKFNKPDFLKKIKHWVINKASNLITVSQSLKKYCQKNYQVDPNHIIQLPTGIDCQLFYNKKMIRKNDFLYVGRLIKEKGVYILLESIQMLLKTNKALQFTIIGSGYLYEEIENLINTQKLHKNIHLIGSIKHEDIADYYNSHKFLIVPAIKPEGLGLTPIEAMACGCIPIVSDISALNEVVSTKTGFLVLPNNAILLSKQMLSALNQFSNLETLQQNAMEEATSNFSWDIIAKKHLALYNHLIHSNTK